MSTYTIGYDFNPFDTVYCLIGNCIKSGQCLETTIQIYPLNEQQTQTTTKYIVLFDDKTSALVKDTNIFADFTSAAAALQNLLTTQAQNSNMP